MAEVNILGIDLGTTYSAAAIWTRNGPRIIPNRHGTSLTPSVVALDPATKEVVVGHSDACSGKGENHA